MPNKARKTSKKTSKTKIHKLNDELEQLTKGLKLKHMQQHLGEALEHAQTHGLSYTEFLARLLRDEYQAQQARAIESRIKRAKMPNDWTLHSFPWALQPAVSRAQIEQIAELDFIGQANNVVFIGPTGVGKTGLACAILRRALEAGFRGLFIKAQDLFDDAYTTLADHSSRRLINRLCKLDLLLIDEMGYLNLRPQQSNIFFKLMDERYQRNAPTLITTNLEYEQWYDFLGHKTLVEALLDRLRHHCQTITIEGQSLRAASHQK